LKVLLVGYGSIGKRHFEILKKFDEVDTIDVVTKQIIDVGNTYKSLHDIHDLNIYDYFVIATETSKHFEQLNYICHNTRDKNILVEKPLFDKKYTFEEGNNNIFVAYNLRFHPLLQKLKTMLSDDTVYYVNVLAGQYLPTWRPHQNYKESYSAKLSLGGGVLRDLSHELDYLGWLFGNITILDYINTKISDLEIESDDIFTALGKTGGGTIINVTMDYISKVPLRRLTIHTKRKTIEVNLVTNTLELYNIEGVRELIDFGGLGRNYTYSEMHRAIFNNDNSAICDFKNGLELSKQIDDINFRSNE